MARRGLLLALTSLGLAALYYCRRRGRAREQGGNVDAFGLPNARLYDDFAGMLFGGFYDLVAREVVTATGPSSTILEIGPGPGHLAVRLASLAPGLRINGLDISPDMVERANARAAAAAVGQQVSFQVGDVAALPFSDGQFDCVITTFSLHHWQDPARGLAEVHRVLKPGGRAYIYDIADRLLRLIGHGRGLTVASPIGYGSLKVIRWPGPLPLIERLELKRGAQWPVEDGRSKGAQA